MIFSQILLSIPKFDPSDPVSDNVYDPTLKSIFKYRKHASILIIEEKFNSNSQFSHVTLDDIYKEVWIRLKHFKIIVSQPE